MPFTKSYRTPTQLTGAARAAFRAFCEQYVTNALFPAQANYTLDFEFEAGRAGMPAAASFRSFNTASQVNTVDAGSKRGGKLPPISIRLAVDEYQQLSMYRNNEAIGVKFEEYAIRNAQSIAARVVLAQAQAIQEGKVVINERKLSFEVDFGRRAGLTANAPTAWSNVGASTPLADLEALRNVFGKQVAKITLSRQGMNYLQSNADLIKIAMQRGTDLPSRISAADVQSVLSDWGFGQLEVNEQTIRNQAGNEVPLFAADKVIFTSSTQIGTTDLGVTAEAIASDNGIPTGQQSGLFSGASPQSDPEGYNVLVSAIVLPVLSSPDNTAVLDAF